ncbi:MAG: hypothetical protein GF405_09960 [Candidatus Eisenbacteria bacterium]|nr:hypothetical protein [Candidatus Eisenbacteria bacterium]
MDMRIRMRLMSLLLVVVFMSAFLVRVASGAEAGADYVLLIDCTGTMRYGGRGDATVTSVREFLAEVGSGDCVSVFGYGEEPMALTDPYPATIEGETGADAVSSSLTFPFEADRTDVTRGLELVWTEREKVFPKRYAPGAGAGVESHLIVLIDGKLIPMYEDYSEYDAIYAASRERLLELASLFAEEGVAVTTVTLGAAEKVDNELMARVAELGGGTHYHVATSSSLGDTFAEMSSALAPAVVSDAEQPIEPTEGEEGRVVEVVAEASAEPTGEEHSAARHGEGAGRVESSLVARYADEDLEELVYQAVIGILGVAIGFVAIGIYRHESWARAFTKPLLKKEIRVKGYLKPRTRCDVMSARAAIPIENPGLPALQVGEGADHGAWLRGVLVEFIGTPDDSAPTIRVHKGEVLVDDQPVEEERKLQDGDRIQLGDECYTYLRGTRR